MWFAPSASTIRSFARFVVDSERCADEAHHSERTVFSGSDHPLTFGDSEDGGGLLSYLNSYTEHRSSFNGWLERQFRIRVQGKVWSLIVKTSEGGVECDLFPALSGRGQGSRISIAAPLKEAVIIKITKANNIDSTFYHQKKLKMLTQTPKPSAQAVVWAMKQQWRSTATMVANMEAPHQYLSVWRDALMMKLKILNERPLTQARLSPTRQSRLFEGAILNCNAKKAEFGRKTDR